MVSLSPTRYTRNERADLWAAVIVGAIAAVAVVVIAAIRVAGLFTPEGISVAVPIAGVSAELPLGPGGAPVAGAVTEARLVVGDVDALSISSLVGAIVVSAVAYLLTIGFTVKLSINLMRGRAFSRQNSRLVYGISIVVMAGALASTLLEIMGLNGVYAALGGPEFDGHIALYWANWPIYLAAIGLGILAIAFRVGERLQRDAEGLV